jgi:hypothetical protein
MENPSRRCPHWCGWRCVIFVSLERKMGDCQGYHLRYVGKRSPLVVPKGTMAYPEDPHPTEGIKSSDMTQISRY